MQHLVALLGVVIISFSAIWVGMAAVSPATASFFRCAYAVPPLLVLALKGGRPTRSSHWVALAAGLVLSVDLSLWHWSIDLIGAGLATVLANTQVLFVGLGAWLFHRERPSGAALVAIPAILIGVTFISGLGRPDAFGRAPLTGTLAGALTGLTYAIFILVYRKATLTSDGAAAPLLVASMGGVLGSIAVGLVDSDLDLTPHFPSHYYLLGLALASQVIGWLIMSRVLARLPVLQTSVLLLLQPVLSVVWAVLLLGEGMSTVQLAGVVLVVAGVGFVSLRGAVHKSPA